MQAVPEDALRPLIDFFPGRSRRWISDLCTSPQRPSGAIKIGHVWSIRERDFRAWVDRTAGMEASHV